MPMCITVKLTAYVGHANKCPTTAGSGELVPRRKQSAIRGQQANRRGHRQGCWQNQRRVCTHSRFRSNMHSNLYSVDKKKKFSRKRNNEEEGDITYINERNKVFNKKVCPRPTFLVPFRRLIHVYSRLHATTTSTRRRYVRASSVAQLYNFLFLSLSSICVTIYLVPTLTRPCTV